MKELQITAFEEFWRKYPPVGNSCRRMGKKAAERAYKRALKTSTHENIMGLLEDMLAHEWKGKEPRWIPHASTWLNRESFDEASLQIGESAKEARRHICETCAEPHFWDEPESLANWSLPYFSQCPESLERQTEQLKRQIDGKSPLLQKKDLKS